MLATVLPAVISWEQNLRDAASLVAPIPSLQARAQAVKAGKPLQGDTVTALTSELSTALNFRIDPSMVVDAAFELRYRRAVAALPLLLAANTPPDSDTTHAAARLMLQAASMESIRGNPAAAAFGADAAEKLAIDFCASTTPRPSQLAWLGMLREARFERFDHDPAHLRAAITVWEQAVALAPHEPLYTSELARANAALGQREEAAKWAAKSLAINQELHLDPLRQFSQADLDALSGPCQPDTPHQTPPRLLDSPPLAVNIPLPKARCLPATLSARCRKARTGNGIRVDLGPRRSGQVMDEEEEIEPATSRCTLHRLTLRPRTQHP